LHGARAGKLLPPRSRTFLIGDYHIMRQTLAAAASAFLLSGCAATAIDAPMAAAPLPSDAPAFVPPAANVTSDLPRNAAPSLYRIHVRPDMDALTFAANSSVEIEVFEPSDALVLHANNLDITKAMLVQHDGGTPRAMQIAMDEAAQTVRFADGAPIVPGRYRLDTDYTGTINTQANGLFALDYPDKRTGDPKRGLFTQFEAPDARRFAPMFDEPSYKAVFELSADVPAEMMPLSNMPIASTEDFGPLKRVVFEPSPIMSSYLLFFGLGDFERRAKIAPDGTEVGIVAPTGSGDQMDYALDELAILMPYFNEYFGVDYPLPKLDNIAGPGSSQFFGAMENWGAIFTFERILLVDPAITSPGVQQSLTGTQAHEVAHQWFGNIVTMAWWDDLWLNEGFASWMATKATDNFHPEWYPLLSRVGGREGAMGVDSIVTTHPVVQEVRTVSEIGQAFDTIAYQKGEAVISMLEAYAGEDVWREGIRTYMQRHKYDNTKSEDLWRAVEDAGASDLTAIAYDFTRQEGVPLVRVESAVCDGGTTRVALSQSQFSVDRKDEVAADPTSWRVPLRIGIAGNAAQRQVLQGDATYTLEGCGPLIVNGGQLGYFRTLYPETELVKLAQAMPALPPIEQLGIYRDQIALGSVGYQDLGPALDLLAAIPVDANPVVAQSAISRFADMYDVLGDDQTAEKAKLRAVASAIWRPRLEQLGFEPRAGESLADAQLRTSLIGALGTMGDEEVVEQASTRFAALADDPRSLDGPLKTTWLNIAASKATPQQWTLLAELAAKSTSSVEQQTYYALLGAAEDEALARRALALALSGEAGLTTSGRIINAVAGSNGDLAANFVLDNRTAIDALIDDSGKPRFYARTFYGVEDDATIERIRAYRATLAEDEGKPIDQALIYLAENNRFLPQNRAQLIAWLATR
jgi:aminopeptidase N